MFHVLVALQVLGVLAVFQLLVHDAVSQLGRGERGKKKRVQRSPILEAAALRHRFTK